MTVDVEVIDDVVTFPKLMRKTAAPDTIWFMKSATEGTIVAGPSSLGAHNAALNPVDFEDYTGKVIIENIEG